MRISGWLRSTRLVAALGLAVTGGVIAPSISQASAAETLAPPPIAYPSYTRTNASLTLGSTGTLHVVGSDGAGDRLIPTPTPVAGEVSWNPTGTQLAYVAALPDGNHQVWEINADGNDAHAVTPEGYERPIWSPDGTKLAVVTSGSPTDPTSQLAVADLTASTTNTITRNSVSAGTTFGPPAWAPDGSKLAFVTAVFGEGSGGSAAINVINADGTGHVVLPEPMDGGLSATREVAWSPDGQWLAFDGYLAAGDNSRGVLQIVHPDGTGLRTVDAGSSTSYGDGDIGGFSPDGTRVLLTLDTAQSTIVAVSLSGQVTTFHAASTQTDAGTMWSPSAAGIVFCERTFNSSSQTYSSNLFTTAANDSGLTQLTTSGQACDGAVASASPRYAAADRVGTAISSSRANFTHASAVVIARADLYPDALAAAPLAGAVGGPVLLSPPGGATAGVVTETRRLGATTAYLIGDTTALSAKVAADVSAAGVTTIVRIGGPTRYDTAALIAQRVGGTSAYVVRGDNWADAAAVSALAAFQHRPILLTPASTLSPAASAAITAMHTTSATIVGGSAAVSDSTEHALNLAGVTTVRLSGADRWATSAAVASSAVAAGMTGPPWLASGLNWPDAVSAGPAAAASKGVLLLVAPMGLAQSPASQTWLANHPSKVVVAVGGPDVVSPQDVVDAHG